MNIVRVSAIIAIPCIQTLALLLSFRFEQYFYTFALSAFILTDLFLVPFFSEDSDKARIFRYSFPPLALVLSAFSLAFFIEGEGLKIAVLAVNALLQFQYLLSMHFALHRTEQFQMRSMYHSAYLMTLALLFSSASVVYGLSYYLDTLYIYSFPPFLLFFSLVVASLASLQGNALRQNLLFLGSIVLVGAELFLAIALLPSMYYVNAALWTSIVMPALSLSLSSLRKERTAFETIGTCLIGAFVVLLIVATAQWR